MKSWSLWFSAAIWFAVIGDVVTAQGPGEEGKQEVTIGIVVDGSTSEVDAVLRAIKAEFDVLVDAEFGVEYVPTHAGAQEVLKQLDGDEVEAVYFTPQGRISNTEWRKLIKGVNERKIPSFALRGVIDVERGVLAGLLPEMLRLASRRTALNLQQILLGVRPEELSVFLPVQEKLVVNARTAAAIIDLLDAQNQSFSANQRSVIAVYEYLQDLIEYQRSIAWFEKFASEEDVTNYINELKSFVAEENGRTSP